MAGAPDSVALLLFFLFWYVGNAFYNQYNTMALTAVGGKHGGLTMTVSTMQLGVCSLYALVLWIVGLNPIKLCGLQLPEKMKIPQITMSDIKATLPVGFCSAAAHSAGVFCLGADPLFGQIVKAGEPVMSAMVNTVFYNKAPSKAKMVCLVFIVAGVAFASLKKGADGAYALKVTLRRPEHQHTSPWGIARRGEIFRRLRGVARSSGARVLGCLRPGGLWFSRLGGAKGAGHT